VVFLADVVDESPEVPFARGATLWRCSQGGRGPPSSPDHIDTKFFRKGVNFIGIEGSSSEGVPQQDSCGNFEEEALASLLIAIVGHREGLAQARGRDQPVPVVQAAPFVCQDTDVSDADPTVASPDDLAYEGVGGVRRASRLAPTRLLEEDAGLVG